MTSLLTESLIILSFPCSAGGLIYSLFLRRTGQKAKADGGCTNQPRVHSFGDGVPHGPMITTPPPSLPRQT